MPSSAARAHAAAVHAPRLSRADAIVAVSGWRRHDLAAPVRSTAAVSRVIYVHRRRGCTVRGGSGRPSVVCRGSAAGRARGGPSDSARTSPRCCVAFALVRRARPARLVIIPGEGPGATAAREPRWRAWYRCRCRAALVLVANPFQYMRRAGCSKRPRAGKALATSWSRPWPAARRVVSNGLPEWSA